MDAYFIGVDIGTQGARVVLLDVRGNVTASKETVFALNEHSREEQSPTEWWVACLRCLKEVIAEASQGIHLDDIISIAVTSTSGTVIPLNKHNEPLHNAIMYSDKRSVEQGDRCTQIAEKFHAGLGFTTFNSSSGLAKMLWFQDTYPEKARELSRWIHAADFITGMLSGRWGVTDYTNAFKSGYDVTRLEWPAYLYEQLPLKKEWLPEVVASGEVIGTITPALAEELGLLKHVKVVAGATDGCASQIASGAINPGDWNTTIGTTMVVKGVTQKEVLDPFGRIYSHRHPAGYWMPGGASNTGADWITNEFSDDLDGLNAQANLLVPTSHISYPLMQKGERFPMIAPLARGFEPQGLSREERFAANMEGVAYLERYAFELIEELSGEQVKAVYTAGGGSNSTVWLTIRSNVLNRPIFKMKHVSGAVGAAILAASNTYFKSVIEAVRELTVIELKILPDPLLVKQYHNNYLRFLHTMKKKGYITDIAADA